MAKSEASRSVIVAVVRRPLLLLLIVDPDEARQASRQAKMVECAGCRVRQAGRQASRLGWLGALGAGCAGCDAAPCGAQISPFRALPVRRYEHHTTHNMMHVLPTQADNASGAH